ncbi:MAG: orotidine-5'-phosphate decarboxylase [Eubacteriaceae bacterium]|nr:orotidine-5'-phosphate decarboxylase [Eubacteriaceae bacterium]
MIADRLYESAKASPVCVGLDTKIDFLPACLAEKDLSPGEKITAFNRAIVDATADLAGCYKVQIACYEALGLDGLKAYADTVAYARAQGKIVIGDCKRGDISSTAAQYAKGHFEGDFEVDILTVNAYMGLDAVSPYFPYIENNEKGLFVLLHTSNPSAVDLQEDNMSDGRMVYEKMADLIDEWGKPYIGESGFSAIGAVVGLTYPEAFEALQQAHPHLFYLVPGYGAQGGTGRDIADILKRSRCAVVNSSRGIICAHKGKTEGEDYIDYIRKAAADMKEDLTQWL